MDETQRSPRQAARPTITLGLVADPGLAAELARWLAAQSSALLARRVSDAAEWRVEVVVHTIRLDEHSRIPMVRIAGDMIDEHGWDMAILLTDLPQGVERAPVLAQAGQVDRFALVSLPTHGALRLRQRVRTTVLRLVRRHARAQHLPLAEDSAARRLVRSVADFAAPTRWSAQDDRDIAMRIVTTGLRGRLRLLAGIVRTNRPWRLSLGMSSLLAAALGTTAYAQFNSTIWQLSEALDAGRLVLITVLALGLMVAWLIIDHHLWEWADDPADRIKARLYNVATVVTLSIGVLCLYVTLFVLVFLPSQVILEPSVLRAALHQPVGPHTYLSLAWLASSLGTVAGALGSGLEDDAVVRRAAYGHREQERRIKAEQRKKENRAQHDTDSHTPH